MLYAEKIKSGLRPHFHRLMKRKDLILHGGCAVLLYHRVTKLDYDPQSLAVFPHNFNSHLEILRQKYHVLTPEEFTYYFTNSKRFPKHSVLLTFDDGYADNHFEARPILEALDMRALFYICTGFIATQQEYWWDELERLFSSELHAQSDLVFSAEGISVNCCTNDEVANRPTYFMLCEQLKRLVF